MQNKNSHTLFDFMYPSGTNELWQDIVGYEDGGFVGYQYGSGATAEQILADQGLTATPEQLALFADMDTTQIQDLATGLQDTLGAGGVQLAQKEAGAGFAGAGAGAQELSKQRRKSEKALATGIERAKTAFESQTLGTAADIVAGGGEFGEISTDTSTSGGYVAPGTDPTQTAPPGWPSANSYDQWVQAGSDPSTAVNYGWVAVNPGDTPGYKG